MALAAIAALLISGTSAKAQCVVPSITPETEEDAYENSRRFDAFFLEAIAQEEKGNIDAAYELLRHSMKINSQAPEALSAMAQLLTISGEPDSTGNIVAMLKCAIELEPKNYDFQKQLADYYDDIGQRDSAAARYEIMAKLFPEHDDLLYDLADIYRDTRNYEALLRTLNRMEVQEGKTDEITIGKVNAYVQLQRLDTARALLDEAIAADSTNTYFRVIRAGLYADMNENDKALSEYKKIIAADKSNELALLSLMNYYHKVHKKTEFVEMATSIAEDTAMNTRTRIEALKSLIISETMGETDSTTTESIFKKISDTPAPQKEILSFYLSYLEMKKAPDDAKAPVWKKIIQLYHESPEIRADLLKYNVIKGDYNEILSVCEDGMTYESENPLYYYFGGVALYNLKEKVRACDVLSKGMPHAIKLSNGEFAADMLALRGDIYHDLGEKERSYQNYDSALIYNPENINVLNNYAYFLSLDSQDLDKAAAMSLKTIQTQPKTAIYLDTYAWVLFRQNKYADALKFIQEAIENLDPKEDNSTIYEHAGDINAQLGNTNAALDMWKKAKAKGGSKLLKKKIKQRKYISY